MPIALISYPRSGNHIARAILEYGTGRPTIGVRASDTDPPIYLRKPNKRVRLIDISDETPVAWKAHTLLDVQANERISGQPFDRLVLVSRPPSECIVSQVYRCMALKRQWLIRRRHVRNAVHEAAMNYLSLVGLHAMWPEDKRFLITFDDLVHDEEAAHRLIRFAGGRKCPDGDTLHKIRELARDSQRSLGKIEKPDLYEWVVRETAVAFRSDAIPDID